MSRARDTCAVHGRVRRQCCGCDRDCDCDCAVTTDRFPVRPADFGGFVGLQAASELLTLAAGTQETIELIQVISQCAMALQNLQPLL